MEPLPLDGFPRFNQYREERDALLTAIGQHLDNDPRVKAAWLFGSLGRDDADALSDIDLFVVVEDAAIDAIIAAPSQMAAQAGQPLLYIQAPQNAPEGGAYLMACYDAPVAPHLVDWYWQPLSLAYIPGQVRLLFDKAGINTKDLPVSFPGRPAGEQTLERPADIISFFWAMLMITAKQACRDPRATEMALLPHLLNQLAKARHILGQDGVIRVPPHALPEQKIHLLVKLAGEMNTLMASIAQRGEEVPGSIVPGAARYLQLAENFMTNRV